MTVTSKNSDATVAAEGVRINFAATIARNVLACNQNHSAGTAIARLSQPGADLTFAAAADTANLKQRSICHKSMCSRPAAQDNRTTMTSNASTGGKPGGEQDTFQQ
jgi:hypothetical protein